MIKQDVVQENLEVNNLDLAEARKVYVMDEEGGYIQAKEHKGIWNVTKDMLGCIASKTYNIIQHRDVMRTVLNAMRNLNLNYCVDVKVDGHRIFVDVEFPDAKIGLKEVGEEFISGLRLINSYDKTTGLLILPRIKRLVCSNGMVVNRFVSGCAIRHNQKLAEDFEGVIEKTLKNVINSSEVLKNLVNASIADSVEWQYVELVLKNLIKREKHIKEILDRLEKKETVTRWDLYNAITDYATHGEQLKPTIENWLQNKSQVLLEKPLEVFQEKEVLN